MTRREKILASTLLAVMLVFGGGLLFHLFVYEPMSTVRAQLEVERNELLNRQNQLAQERQRIDRILEVDPRLVQWAQLSLPPRDPALKKARLPLEEQKRKHLANLRVAYEAYLFNLMEGSQFRRGSIKVEVRQNNNRAPTGPAGKEKQAPYEQLTFGVVGEGTMESVARMMRDFYRTPLLHHVRNMTLGLANERGDRKVTPGLLKMDLTVDALAVVGGEERSGMMPTKLAYPPPVLAEPPRNYLVLDRVNMFTGLKRVEEESSASAANSPEVQVEVLRFIKLTSLIWDERRGRWEGTLYDQARGGREKVINTGSRDEFTIFDKNDNTVFEAKVVRVEEDQVILLAGGKYYRLRCGEFLGLAVRNPLLPVELTELGITPDRAGRGDRTRQR